MLGKLAVYATPIALILAVILAFIPGIGMFGMALLMFMGIVVGLFNVTEKETVKLVLLMVLIGITGVGFLTSMPYVGEYFTGFFNYLGVFFTTFAVTFGLIGILKIAWSRK